MKFVKAMKPYGHIRVANAMSDLGYYWENPRCVPTNIEKMVEALPRHDLERILSILIGRSM